MVPSWWDEEWEDAVGLTKGARGLGGWEIRPRAAIFFWSTAVVKMLQDWEVDCLLKAKEGTEARNHKSNKPVLSSQIQKRGTHSYLQCYLFTLYSKEEIVEMRISKKKKRARSFVRLYGSCLSLTPQT